ncbi:hypothetical protein ACHQM5_006602 [Ranunculus cassubicifolius]
MERKVFAVFMVCMVLLGVLHLQQVTAEEHHGDHAECFNYCKPLCMDSNEFDEKFCDLKCDNFCGDNVVFAPSMKMFSIT